MGRLPWRHKPVLFLEKSMSSSCRSFLNFSHHEEQGWAGSTQRLHESRTFWSSPGEWNLQDSEVLPLISDTLQFLQHWWVCCIHFPWSNHKPQQLFLVNWIVFLYSDLSHCSILLCVGLQTSVSEGNKRQSQNKTPKAQNYYCFHGYWSKQVPSGLSLVKVTEKKY